VRENLVVETEPQTRREDRLLRNVLFAFFVSGAASQPLGSFIPFLRQTYGFHYDLSGVLLSCQSIGNLGAVLLAGMGVVAVCTVLLLSVILLSVFLTRGNRA